MRRAFLTAGVSVVAVFMAGCGATGLFREPSAIKPLEEYRGDVQRDMAQMLYPGFREIQADIRERFPDKNLRFREKGLQVVEQRETGGYTDGYYVKILLEAEMDAPSGTEFLSQARQLTRAYLDPVLVAVSRDWNNVFSPSIAGIMVEFIWESGETNLLEFVLNGTDVQQYLNAKMTMQELLDRNWIRAKSGPENLGRIEINTLISQHSVPEMQLLLLWE